MLSSPSILFTVISLENNNSHSPKIVEGSDMPQDDPMISSKSREILNKVRHLVPPMLEKFHKGQLGRVAVIGGSQDYTGAPFFSAMASARLGADMSHIICEPDAAQVIKTYSPNLMVHPLMRQSTKSYDSATTYFSPEDAAKEIIDTLLPRLHAIVIGPGLGRDKSMQETSRLIVAEAKRTGLPLVLDADGLMLVNNDPDLIRGCETCVLTPNVVEFGRLAKALDVKLQGEGNGSDGGSTGDCERVSQALGGVLIVQKGPVDYISNGAHTLVSDLTGGLKRSGGQGDTLTGATVTMLAWRRAYHDVLWEVEGDLSEKETLLLAAFGGSAITRECSRLAFKKCGRALQASDVGEQVPAAFLSLIGEKEQQQQQQSKI